MVTTPEFDSENAGSTPAEATITASELREMLSFSELGRQLKPFERAAVNTVMALIAETTRRWQSQLYDMELEKAKLLADAEVIQMNIAAAQWEMSDIEFRDP